MIHRFFFFFTGLVLKIGKVKSFSPKNEMCAHFVKMVHSACDTVRLISVKIGKVTFSTSLIQPQ